MVAIDLGGKYAFAAFKCPDARQRNPTMDRFQTIGTARDGTGPDGTGRMVTRGLLGAAYLAAGVLHLATPAPFLKITPGWVPYPATVIALTGLCELAGYGTQPGVILRNGAGVARCSTPAAR